MVAPKAQTFLTMFVRKGLCVKKHLRVKYSVCNSLCVCVETFVCHVFRVKVSVYKKSRCVRAFVCV